MNATTETKMNVSFTEVVTTMNVSSLMMYPCTPGTQLAILYATMQQRMHAKARIKESRTKWDSHTNTCVVGKNAMIFHETHRYVQVSPFLDSLRTLSHVLIMSAAVAYDDHSTGAFLINDMDTNFSLCPMQLRMNEVSMNGIPKFLSDDPNDQSHALSFPNEEGYIIPLSSKGMTSYFLMRKLTLDEYNHCRCIELSYESPEWNPHSQSFAQQEEAMTDGSGHLGPLHPVGSKDQFTHSRQLNTAQWSSARYLCHRLDCGHLRYSRV